MKLASFFSGAGGLDRGFENAGFNVVYANEYDNVDYDDVDHMHESAVTSNIYICLNST